MLSSRLHGATLISASQLSPHTDNNNICYKQLYYYWIYFTLNVYEVLIVFTTA